MLAEGVETPRHLDVARSFGARLAQGWLFGRPSTALCGRPAADAWIPRFPADLAGDASPFELLPPGARVRRATKALLIELSKRLEREALAHGETAIVAAAFQDARHFTAPTRRRFARLAASAGFVCALGAGLADAPYPGIRGASLAPGDPLLGEWDVVVLTPHFSAALLARDLGDGGADLDRRFVYAITYRREIVERAAAALLSRVAALAVDGPVEPRRAA